MSASSQPPGEWPRPTPSVGLSLLPVVALVVLLAAIIGGLDAGGHIPLVLATAVAAGVAAWGLKMPWKQIEAGMVRGISGGLPAVLVLLLVGMLVGVWIAAGVVPLLSAAPGAGAAQAATGSPPRSRPRRPLPWRRPR